MKDVDWIAKNAYFEARQEDATLQQRANVAQVVRNRVKSGLWGNTYKDVITYKHNCEFSWYCDKRSDNYTDYIFKDKRKAQLNQKEFESLVKSYYVAELVYEGKTDGTVNGALFYHAKTLNPIPKFFKTRKKVLDDGLHIFYL